MVLMTAWMLCASFCLTGCNQKAIQRTATEVQTDQQLAEQVKGSFEKSVAFKFPDVQVASFKGKIQLSGFVQSDDQKRAAETMAKENPGVVGVENRISLKK